ncbi:hypothetical protein NBRC116493_00380 [Aurantivibrio infirmus]
MMNVAIQQHSLALRILSIASCLVVALFLGGCGQKGDLYIPQDEQALTMGTAKPANNKPTEL